MTNDDLMGERKRFAKVVAARKTNRELLELFDRLGSSDKFLEGAKPYLFGELIEACVRRMSERQTLALLETIEAVGAARLIRSALVPAEADVLLRGLVKKTFVTSPKNESSLMEAFLRLESSGISEDRCHTLALALEARMPVEEVDHICEQTFYAYYPTAPRPVAARELVAVPA